MDRLILGAAPATAAAYRQSLATALAAGAAVLKRNGTALDAVQAAVEPRRGSSSVLG